MGYEPIIYAHRGLWTSRNQQNSVDSVIEASRMGFGVEIDFRSQNGSFVISHDPYLSSRIENFNHFDFHGIPVAMNVKEDGLVEQYKDFLQKYPHEHSFIFDGSIPEMVKIRDRKLPHALRLSEYEEDLPWETNYIWVDAFHSEWWIESNKIERLLQKHFLVFVSPELHGRDCRDAWEYFRRLQNGSVRKFGVCTDLPIQLEAFLNE